TELFDQAYTHLPNGLPGPLPQEIVDAADPDLHPGRAPGQTHYRPMPPANRSTNPTAWPTGKQPATACNGIPRLKPFTPGSNLIPKPNTAPKPAGIKTAPSMWRKTAWTVTSQPATAIKSPCILKASPVTV